MLKILAILFGLVMIVVGILGFLPDFTPNNKLLNLFLVNPMHNVVHLVTGIAALICGLTSGLASKLFFIIFGIIYGIVAILGFMIGQGLVLDMIAVNQADNWLHAAIAAFSLYFGFFVRSGS